jgi:hypothetical protein
MGLSGTLRDDKPLRNLPVAQTPGNKLGDLALSRRERPPIGWTRRSRATRALCAHTTTVIGHQGLGKWFAAPRQPPVGSHVTVGRRRQNAPLEATGVPSPNLVLKKRHDCYDARLARGTAADDPCFGASPSTWDMLARHHAMPGLQLLQPTAARTCCDPGESCAQPGRDRRRLRQLPLGDLEVRMPDPCCWPRESISLERGCASLRFGRKGAVGCSAAGFRLSDSRRRAWRARR